MLSDANKLERQSILQSRIKNLRESSVGRTHLRLTRDLTSLPKQSYLGNAY